MKIANKIFFSLLPFLIASPVLAEEDIPTIGDLGNVVDKVVSLILPIAGIACVVFIIIGGYMWITSAGDPSKIKQAQGTLTWAIIGLVVILMATAIISVVTKFVE